MAPTKRIGVEIDKDLWREFREDVKARHHRTNGVLSTELENAIRQYLYTGAVENSAEYLRDMNDRLKRIENAVETASADGGRTLSTAEATHTHRPSTPYVADHDTDAKPHPKAARSAKAAWLTEQYADAEAVHLTRDLRETVDRAYSFNDDAAERLVEAAAERLELVAHPRNADLLVTPDERERLLEDDREAAEELTEAALDTLDAEALDE